MKDILELLKKPEVSVPAVGFALGSALFYYHGHELSQALIITILAFLASDLLFIAFIRGGSGILQISIFGRETRPKGHGFIAFFLSILIVSAVVDQSSQRVATYISSISRDFIANLIVGLALACLVYSDMNAKFYARSKANSS